MCLILALRALISTYKRSRTRSSTAEPKSACPAPSPQSSTAARSYSSRNLMSVEIQAGATVHYKARPSWGLGRVMWISPDGVLMVRFAGVNYCGEFAMAELEDASPLTVAA